MNLPPIKDVFISPLDLVELEAKESENFYEIKGKDTRKSKGRQKKTKSKNFLDVWTTETVEERHLIDPRKTEFWKDMERRSLEIEKIREIRRAYKLDICDNMSNLYFLQNYGPILVPLKKGNDASLSSINTQLQKPEVSNDTDVKDSIRISKEQCNISKKKSVQFAIDGKQQKNGAQAPKPSTNNQKHVPDFSEKKSDNNVKIKEVSTNRPSVEQHFYRRTNRKYHSPRYRPPQSSVIQGGVEKENEIFRKSKMGSTRSQRRENTSEKVEKTAYRSSLEETTTDIKHDSLEPVNRPVKVEVDKSGTENANVASDISLKPKKVLEGIKEETPEKQEEVQSKISTEKPDVTDNLNRVVDEIKPCEAGKKEEVNLETTPKKEKVTPNKKKYKRPDQPIYVPKAMLKNSPSNNTTKQDPVPKRIIKRGEPTGIPFLDKNTGQENTQSRISVTLKEKDKVTSY